MTESRLTTYYNGACPICSAEIQHYIRAARRHGAPLTFVDLSQHPDALACHGIDRTASFRRLYAVDRHGQLLQGLAAFRAVWKQLPRWRWLAWASGLPLIRPAVAWTYEHVAARAIFRWNQRRGTAPKPAADRP